MTQTNSIKDVGNYILLMLGEVGKRKKNNTFQEVAWKNSGFDTLEKMIH